MIMDTLTNDVKICENEDSLIEKKNKGPKCPIRYIQAVLIFLIVVAISNIGTSLSIAILAMSEKSNNDSSVEVYDWDKNVQGYIFSACSSGVILTQILAGIAVNRYGSRMFLFFSTVITALLMLFVPWAASIGGWQGVCAIMFLQGICQGFLYPSIYSYLGYWAPVNERTRLGMFIFSGFYFGMVVTPPLAAYIGTSSLGWPWIFYFFGTQALIGGVLWYMYGASTPADCKIISAEERTFIEKSLQNAESNKPKKTPWKSIFTCVPFYALLCAQIGGDWGFNMIFKESPSYFNFILGVELKNCGYLTSLGYINALIFTAIITYAADYLLNKNYLSNTNIRKVFNTIGSWGAAICMIATVLIPAEYNTLIIVIVIMTAGLDATNSCGYMVNHVDLSPRYTSILVGVSYTITDSVNLLGPLTTGYIIGDDMTNLVKWRYVYLISAGMYLLGSIVFIMFGSGDKQKWDDFESDKSNNQDADISVELLEMDTKLKDNKMNE